MRWSAGKLTAGACVYAATVYGAYVWRRNRLAQETGERLASGADVTEAERLRLFGALADKYDCKVERDEESSGITALRRQLLEQAQGSVLEVACGTGRNAEFYRAEQVTALTMVDASGEMLAKARNKRPARLAAVDYRQADAQRLPFDSEQFDCVVDTFGLCSFEQPQRALQELCRVLKPGGRALLLEHGRSDRWFVRPYQNLLADSHLRSWGCYWNRPIADIVADSPLIVDAQQSASLGTITLIVAHRPLPEERLQANLPIAALTPIL